MSHTRTNALLLATSLFAACAGDEAPGDRPDPSDPDAVFAVTARDRASLPTGEAILNLHWFPRGGEAGELTLRVNGKTAIWGDTGEAPPHTDLTAGSAVEAHPETGVPTRLNPPIGLPPGTYDLEYALGDDVVVSVTGQALEAGTIYALVAHGEPAAPSFTLFSDANPKVSPELYPDDVLTLRVVNFATSGAAAQAFSRPAEEQAYGVLFQDLAYGAEWSGTVVPPAAMMFEDGPFTEIPLGGFGVIMDGKFARLYLYDRAPNTRNLVPLGDGAWAR